MKTIKVRHDHVEKKKRNSMQATVGSLVCLIIWIESCSDGKKKKKKSTTTSLIQTMNWTFLIKS